DGSFGSRRCTGSSPIPDFAARRATASRTPRSPRSSATRARSRSPMSRAFTALVDLTVLASPSRARGIGRYAADLGRALAARSRAAADGVSVRAVESLPWIGPGLVSDDAAAAVSRLAAGGQTLRHPQWAWRVRMRLARAARYAGADVVHSVHPDATPLG